MIKYSKHFAFLPVKVTSGQRVWLKYYYRIRSSHDENTGRPPLSSAYFEYTETAGERVWRLLKGK